MRHILHKIALSPYTALSPIGPHCVPMGLNPSVVSFFFLFRPPEAASPAPPVWERPHAARRPFGKGNFNPRSPCGERPEVVLDGLSDSTFQSTLPVWGATDGHQRRACGHRNFNPRSPCGERPIAAAKGNQQCDFNPRSPCGERLGPDIFHSAHFDFNPRSPCGERRCLTIWASRKWRFQSTLPVWGATGRADINACYRGHFNPRSPCGERPQPPLWV